VKQLSGGTLNLAGGTTWRDSGDVALASTATINNSGTFTIQNDEQLGGGTFNNTGTLTKSAGPGTTSLNDVAFTSSGTANGQSGTLDVSVGYTQNGGTTTVAAGTALVSSGSHSVTVNAGTLSGNGSIGSGTVRTDLTNSGTVSPGASPGTLTVNGDYTQTNTG